MCHDMILNFKEYVNDIMRIHAVIFWFIKESDENAKENQQGTSKHV